jgi:hypothetical protein
MLEKVPPAITDSFWYASSSRLWLLKYAMDVTACAHSRWYYWFGGVRASQSAWKLLVGVPFGALCALRYASQPQLAASFAAELASAPDIRQVRFTFTL